MRYYVIAPTGERYGPADIPTLNEWAATGRLFGSSRLMEEMSGTVVAASSVAGLAFGPGASPVATAPMQPQAPMQPFTPSAPMQPMQPMQPGAGYTPGHGYSPHGMATDDGKKDLLLAFATAFGAPLLGFITIYGVVLAIGGVQFGWKAMQKGQKLGLLALILNIVAVPAALIMRFYLRYKVIRGY